MTDRYLALSMSSPAGPPTPRRLLGNFRTMFTADPLVLDKWLAQSAMVRGDDVIDRIKAILAVPGFPQNNPIPAAGAGGNFGLNNPSQFARLDGAGFRFVAEFVADVDKRNPQVAARMLTAFRVWRSFEPVRRAAAEGALTGLRDAGGLSRNTTDILERDAGPVNEILI